MVNLGYYYYNQKDYQQMLKYYFLNIQHGNIDYIPRILSCCIEYDVIDIFVKLYREFSHIILITSEDKSRLTRLILQFLNKGLISIDLIKLIIDIDIDGCDDISPIFKFIKRMLTEKMDLIDISDKNDFIARLL